MIHTRVPAVLEQELKRLAESVRLPVSNLIRSILEDAVDMADRAGRGVEEELRHAASTLSSKRARILGREGERHARGEAVPAVGRPPLEGILGFQPITLALDGACAQCAARLQAGDEAQLGISADAGAPRVIVCNSCTPRRRERPPAAGDASDRGISPPNEEKKENPQ